MTVRGAAAAALALGLLASACADGGTTSPASTTTAAPVTREAGPTLATYRRSGGLAGRRFEVVVRPDGTFEGSGSTQGRGRLAAAGLEELRSLVAAFAAAVPAQTYGEAVPDGFTTSVTAGGASTSVLTGATPPPPVQQLISFLAGLERQLPR